MGGTGDPFFYMYSEMTRERKREEEKNTFSIFIRGLAVTSPAINKKHVWVLETDRGRSDRAAAVNRHRKSGLLVPVEGNSERHDLDR